MLENVNLEDVDLTGASFANAQIDGGNWARADATDASFAGATMKGTLLDYATLTRTSFRGARLTEVSFVASAGVSDADFNGAELVGCVDGATFDGGGPFAPLAD